MKISRKHLSSRWWCPPNISPNATHFISCSRTNSVVTWSVRCIMNQWLKHLTLSNCVACNTNNVSECDCCACIYNHMMLKVWLLLLFALQYIKRIPLDFFLKRVKIPFLNCKSTPKNVKKGSLVQTQQKSFEDETILYI